VVSPTLVNEAAFTASEDRDWNDVAPNGRYDQQPIRHHLSIFVPRTKDLPNKIPRSRSRISAPSTAALIRRSRAARFLCGRHVDQGVGNHTFNSEFTSNVRVRMTATKFHPLRSPVAQQSERTIFVQRHRHCGDHRSRDCNAALRAFQYLRRSGQKDYTPYRATATELFVQDGWKINSRFKLITGFASNIGPRGRALGNIASFNPPVL